MLAHESIDIVFGSLEEKLEQAEDLGTLCLKSSLLDLEERIFGS